MYIHYSIGNNSGLRTLVHIVEVSVIGGVRFQRFHCIHGYLQYVYYGILTVHICNTYTAICYSHLLYFNASLMLL